MHGGSFLQPLRLGCTVRRIQLGAFNLIDVKGIVSAEGHGKAASVKGDTGSTAFSLLHDSLIRDC